MNATEIRDKVTAILAAAGVAYSVRYAGETAREQQGTAPWKCDAWRVTFKPAGGKAWETDYFTGLGHRKMPKGFVWDYDKGARPNTLAWERNEALKKPVAPKAADVLYSLVSDAGAGDMSFQDWCAEYGYSDDSLSAFDTYRACCETYDKLRATFKPETLTAIRDAVQEL